MYAQTQIKCSFPWLSDVRHLTWYQLVWFHLETENLPRLTLRPNCEAVLKDHWGQCVRQAANQFDQNKHQRALTGSGPVQQCNPSHCNRKKWKLFLRDPGIQIENKPLLFIFLRSVLVAHQTKVFSVNKVLHHSVSFPEQSFARSLFPSIMLLIWHYKSWKHTLCKVTQFFSSYSTSCAFSHIKRNIEWCGEIGRMCSMQREVWTDKLHFLS